MSLYLYLNYLATAKTNDVTNDLQDECQKRLQAAKNLGAVDPQLQMEYLNALSSLCPDLPIEFEAIFGTGSTTDSPMLAGMAVDSVETTTDSPMLAGMAVNSVETTTGSPMLAGMAVNSVDTTTDSPMLAGMIVNSVETTTDTPSIAGMIVNSVETTTDTPSIAGNFDPFDVFVADPVPSTTPSVIDLLPWQLITSAPTEQDGSVFSTFSPAAMIADGTALLSDLVSSVISTTAFPTFSPGEFIQSRYSNLLGSQVGAYQAPTAPPDFLSNRGVTTTTTTTIESEVYEGDKAAEDSTQQDSASVNIASSFLVTIVLMGLI